MQTYDIDEQLAIAEKNLRTIMQARYGEEVREAIVQSIAALKDLFPLQTSAIVDGAVTSDKIADGSITSEKLTDSFLTYKGVIADNSIISDDESIDGLDDLWMLPLEKGWVFKIQGTQWWQVISVDTDPAVTETMMLKNNSVIVAVDVHPYLKSSWLVLVPGDTNDMDVDLMDGEALYYREGAGDATEEDIERYWTAVTTTTFTISAGVYMFACEKEVICIRDRNMLDNTDSFDVSRAGRFYVYTYKHPTVIPMEFTVYF